jgi:hypothetical protein
MNTFTVIKTSASAIALSLLLACGGGNTTPTTTASSYETLSSTATANSTLGGVAIQTNNGTKALSALQVSGSLQHNTGATTINDGTYSLTDPNGFDSNQVLTDGSSTLTSDGTQGFSGTYDYATAYTQTYTSGGQTYNVTGIGGIVTTASEIPTAGSATYLGEAIGTIVTATQGIDLNNGTSTVGVDFGTGKVDVIMNGFSAVDQATGNATTAPIDTIQMTGMDISGNGFSGGTITTTNGGAAEDLTGANTTATGLGSFFGYNGTDSIPDEVGGGTVIQGDDGVIVGGFIAD